MAFWYAAMAATKSRAAYLVLPSLQASRYLAPPAADSAASAAGFFLPSASAGAPARPRAGTRRNAGTRRARRLRSIDLEAIRGPPPCGKASDGARTGPMALPRTLEPEVMDTEEEARDYDAMDHAQVNARFCDDLLATGARLGRVLDVGTGTALIPIELCGRDPRVEVDAIDLASHMLALAERNVARAKLGLRIRLARTDAKATPWADGSFDAVMSNSIVHHIPDPGRVLAEVWRLVRPGGV